MKPLKQYDVIRLKESVSVQDSATGEPRRLQRGGEGTIREVWQVNDAWEYEVEL